MEVLRTTSSSSRGGAPPDPRGDGDGCTRDLQDLIAVNEVAKGLDDQASQIGLLAINAMLTCANRGEELPAFTRVAAGMTSWANDLQASTRTLVATANEGVTCVSTIAERARVARILRAAVAAAAHGAATRTARDGADRVEQVVARSYEDLAQCRRALDTTLADLARSGLMATVLSRSALMEAARAPADRREALTLVARDFADVGQRVRDVLDRLRERTEAPSAARAGVAEMSRSEPGSYPGPIDRRDRVGHRGQPGARS